MAKKGKGKGKKGKGGKGKKGKSAEPEPEPKDPLKEFKRFAETYEICCRSYAIPQLDSVLEQIKKWKAGPTDGDKAGEVCLEPQYVCADPRLDALSCKAIAETLMEFDHIRQVAFFAAAVGDEGMLTLADVIKTNKLKSLELVNAARGTAGCQALSNVLRTNASLKVLTLDHNQLGDAGVAALVSELRWNFGLSSLSLKYCDIGPAGAAAIGENLLGSVQSKLQKLSLMGNPLGDEGLVGLSGGPPPAVPALTANKHLTELDLRDVQLSEVEDFGIRALSAMLQTNTVLSTIDLRMNQLGDLAGQIIIQALPPLGTASAIKYVHLSERMKK